MSDSHWVTSCHSLCLVYNGGTGREVWGSGGREPAGRQGAGGVTVHRGHSYIGIDIVRGLTVAAAPLFLALAHCCRGFFAIGLSDYMYISMSVCEFVCSSIDLVWHQTAGTLCWQPDPLCTGGDTCPGDAAAPGEELGGRGSEQGAHTSGPASG